MKHINFGYDANGSPISAEDYLAEEISKMSVTNITDPTWIDEKITLLNSLRKMTIWATRHEIPFHRTEDQVEFKRDLEEARKLIFQ